MAGEIKLEKAIKTKTNENKQNQTKQNKKSLNQIYIQ